MKREKEWREIWIRASQKLIILQLILMRKLDLAVLVHFGPWPKMTENSQNGQKRPNRKLLAIFYL